MLVLMQIITVIAAAIAGLILFFVVTGANGAPQEAAGAAFAVAIIVIPYCVTAMMQRTALIEATKRRDVQDAADVG